MWFVAVILQGKVSKRGSSGGTQTTIFLNHSYDSVYEPHKSLFVDS